jgi:hypothetical protein
VLEQAILCSKREENEGSRGKDKENAGESKNPAVKSKNVEKIPQ